MSEMNPWNATEAALVTLAMPNQTKDGYERDEELAKVEIAVLAVIFVMTVIGNSLVLIAIFLRRKKMSRMYYFILHLSIADLITAFFNVLTQLCWEVTYRFVGGNFLCKFIKYMQILGPYLSSYVLVMTALDRYQAICYPLSNCSWTPRRSKIMIGISWTIALLFCVPQTFIFSYMEVTEGVYDCWGTFIKPWGDGAYVTWYAVSVFIVPLVFLVFAYTCICRAIWLNFNLKIDGKADETAALTSPSPGASVQDTRHWWQRLCHRKPKRQRFYWCASDRFSSFSSSSSGVSERPYRRGENGEERKTLYSQCDTTTALSSPTTNSSRREAPLLTRVLRIKESKSQRKHQFKSFLFGPRGNNGAAHHHADVERPSRPSYQAAVPQCNPRSHSVKGISRAKIKTVKLTVVVIVCYVMCSSPFIAAQLWATWDPQAMSSPFWSGATFTILTLLASLNSCVNPWIYLAFNHNLLLNLVRAFGCFRTTDSPARLERAGTFRSSSLSETRCHRGNGSSLRQNKGDSNLGCSQHRRRQQQQQQNPTSPNVPSPVKLELKCLNGTVKCNITNGSVPQTPTDGGGGVVGVGVAAGNRPSSGFIAVLLNNSLTEV